jgi:hypothetical protein
MNKRQCLTLLMMLISAVSFLQHTARADGGKAELVQIIRQEDGALRALAVEKLISLNLSPEWCQYLLQRDNRGYRTISNVAASLVEVGKTLGYGGGLDLNRSSNEINPIEEDAIAKIQDKVDCYIQLTDNVPDKARPKVIANVAMFERPMTNKYYCKPRGHKLHLFITLDASGQALRYQVGKDGNDYRFTIPAYADLMTSPIQEAFKQGT